MLDKIEEFEVSYYFKRTNETHHYHQIGTVTLSPKGDAIYFVMRKSDNSENLENFTTVILVRNSDYFIKSDYFEDMSEEYELELSEQDSGIVFVLDEGDEKMELRAS